MQIVKDQKAILRVYHVFFFLSTLERKNTFYLLCACQILGLLDYPALLAFQPAASTLNESYLDHC